MKAVWKWVLKPTTEISMPKGAEILSIQTHIVAVFAGHVMDLYPHWKAQVRKDANGGDAVITGNLLHSVISFLEETCSEWGPLCDDAEKLSKQMREQTGVE
jgi:hypothetical protein